MPGYISKAKGTVYGTPQWILDKYLPKTYMDVAPHPWNRENWNGTLDPWSDSQVNFCNPPFKDLAKHWAIKIKKESDLGKKILLLMPVRTSTVYARTKLLPFCSHIVLLPYITFIDHENVCETKIGKFPGSCMLMFFNHKPKEDNLTCTISL